MPGFYRRKTYGCTIITVILWRDSCKITRVISSNDWFILLYFTYTFYTYKKKIQIKLNCSAGERLRWRAQNRLPSHIHFHSTKRHPSARYTPWHLIFRFVFKHSTPIARYYHRYYILLSSFSFGSRTYTHYPVTVVYNRWRIGHARGIVAASRVTIKTSSKTGVNSEFWSRERWKDISEHILIHCRWVRSESEIFGSWKRHRSETLRFEFFSKLIYQKLSHNNNNYIMLSTWVGTVTIYITYVIKI